MDARERRVIAAEGAAEWWVRLQDPKVSTSEREQFVDWLRESPVHVAEMLRVAQVHEALTDFRGWSKLPVSAEPRAPEISDDTVIALRSPTQPEAPRTTKTALLGWRVSLVAAAAIVAVVFSTTLFRQWRSWQTIETERGERREVSLGDGSVLQVGPETRLRVRFTDRQRNVYLDRGATLFRVAKNPRRPFVVETNHTLVRAVGTAFGVEQRGQEVVVTVAEGKVAVQDEETVAPAPSRAAASRGSPEIADIPRASGTPAESLILTAGQQVAVPGTGRMGAVRKVDSERELAWASGRLVFEHTSIDEVVQTFNRYNRLQLTVVDRVLGHREISGVFDASDPESFLAFLTSVTPVRVIRLNAGTVELMGADNTPESMTTDVAR
jgi:transmembrane sensor